MTDVVLIAVIVAFFAAGAGIVRLLDRMITHAGPDADPGADPDAEEAGPEVEPGRPAR
jgi:hypothetical protein